MEEIKIFEDAIADNCKDLKAAGINPTAFWAYRYSKEADNELLDFHEVIWDKDIEAIVKICRENGIEEFTISSTSSSLTEVLAKFDEYGCKIEGITKVNATYTDWTTGKRAVIPAIKMKL